MDGHKSRDYCEKFERTTIFRGEVVAIISDSLGKENIVDEKGLLESYERAARHLPDFKNEARMIAVMMAVAQNMMAVAQKGRAAVQASKLRSGFDLDTSPVNDPEHSANDEYYGADILCPEF